MTPRDRITQIVAMVLFLFFLPMLFFVMVTTAAIEARQISRKRSLSFRRSFTIATKGHFFLVGFLWVLCSWGWYGLWILCQEMWAS